MCLHLIGLLTIYVIPKFVRNGNEGNSGAKRSSNTAALQPSTSHDDTKSENNEKLNKKVMETKHDPMDTDESNFSSSCSSSFNNSMSDINRDLSNEGHHLRKTDTNYLLKDLISKEVNKIKGETDNLSNLLKEKIEAANIEGLIDKTVCGIVELKDDLMRMNEPEVYGPTTVENLRKRNITRIEHTNVSMDDINKGAVSSSDKSSSNGVDAFIKKEIDAIKKEATVIPAVLSNANSAK